MFLHNIESADDIIISQTKVSVRRVCATGWYDFDPAVRKFKGHRGGCKEKRSKNKTLRTHRVGR